MNDLFAVFILLLPIVFCISLVKPSLFKLKSRKQASLIFGSCFVLSFIFFGVTAPSTQPTVTIPTTNPVVVQPTTVATATTAVQTTATKPTPQPVPTVKATPAPQTVDQNTSSVPTQTVSQKNAVKKAKSYLGYSAFSRDGLVAQLEYEQFSHADAVYGADNSGANWNEQAAKKAKSYMSYSSFSRGGLITQLEYEKFTRAQAEYGADAVGL